MLFVFDDYFFGYSFSSNTSLLWWTFSGVYHQSPSIPSLERRSLGNFPASYFPIGSWPLCHPSGVIFHNFSFCYSLSAGPHFCLASIMLCAFTASSGASFFHCWVSLCIQLWFNQVRHIPEHHHNHLRNPPTSTTVFATITFGPAIIFQATALPFLFSHITSHPL